MLCNADVDISLTTRSVMLSLQACYMQINFDIFMHIFWYILKLREQDKQD